MLQCQHAVGYLPLKTKVAGARGKPTMLQLPLQPGYALTIHKVLCNLSAARNRHICIVRGGM